MLQLLERMAVIAAATFGVLLARSKHLDPVGSAVVGSLLPRVPRGLDRWLALPDAVGMALFSIAGAGVAIRTEAFPVSPFLASLFGAMTGAFGGVLGDIAVNDAPRLFQPTTPPSSARPQPARGTTAGSAAHAATATGSCSGWRC